MGLRIFHASKLFLFVFCLICFFADFAQPQPQIPLNSSPAPASKPEVLGPWILFKQKIYPNYKVELLSRSTEGKFPRVESTKIRIIPIEGGSVTQYSGTWINPDPRSYMADYKGPIDLDGDGFEDLILQNYSGGVHCCYQFVIYSLGKTLKKLGDLNMKDCGAQIKVADLNQDKSLEILSCNADFIYLGKLPFSESPFPPAVYSLKNGLYKKSDLDFKQVFLQDIQTQRDLLAKSYNPTAVLQIVADYFLIGDEAQGWKEFESLYQGEDKAMVRSQLLERLGRRATPAPTELPSATSVPLKSPSPVAPIPQPTFGFPRAPSSVPKLP